MQLYHAWVGHVAYQAAVGNILGLMVALQSSHSDSSGFYLQESEM